MILEKSLLDVDFDFSVEDIKNISKLDLNKAHVDDMISIHMLKSCDKSIWKLLSIIFKSCLTQGVLPSEWKKRKCSSNSKKKKKKKKKKNEAKKQCEYRPVSLLPICKNVLERIIYITMFTYFIEKNPRSEDQSGFKPDDSCFNQLVGITR